ncbi:MAG TPA: MBL fold metallo-hydrolase [Asticcacaulis sp.]|nr:MBL fold metallo-hydrolase [Asticcacaulis sp.]
MTPIFANSATVIVPEHLVLARGSARRLRLGVRFGVFVHPTQGPVLIDTGYGPEVTSGKRSFPLWFYALILKPRLEEQPETVLKRLGFATEDVKTVFITHFHADHVSGLRRFSNARFIAAGWEMLRRRTPFDQLRHGVFTELLPADFEARLTPLESLPTVTLPYGLGEGRDVFGDGSILSLPLPGHALGHTGLIWPDAKLIYAADAQWLRQAMRENRPPKGPARWVYEDEAEMRQSLDVLRRAEAAGCDIVFCHDVVK